MTDKKEKELIEGCPWRHFDVFGDPMCQKVGPYHCDLNTGSGMFKEACTGPDCGPMYFADAAFKKFISMAGLVAHLNNISDWDDMLLTPHGNPEWNFEVPLRRQEENKGEGDVPTTEPDGTTKATTPQEDTPSTEGTT